MISRRSALRGAAAVGALASFGSWVTGKVARAQDTAGQAVDEVTQNYSPSYMFVQHASGGSFRPNPSLEELYTLTLEGVGAQTIYFSDRPVRDAGVIANQRFLDGLGFTTVDPPNAALVMATADEHEETVVIELFGPRYDAAARRLTYDARILERTDRAGLSMFNERRGDQGLVEEFASASLFIDGIAVGGALLQLVAKGVQD